MIKFITKDNVEIKSGRSVYWLRVGNPKEYEPLFSNGKYNWKIRQSRCVDDDYLWFKSKKKMIDHIAINSPREYTHDGFEMKKYNLYYFVSENLIIYRLRKSIEKPCGMIPFKHIKNARKYLKNKIGAEN